MSTLSTELTALVEKLRRHEGAWQEWTPAVQMDDRVYSMGYPTTPEVVDEAMTVLYDHGFISFDWMNWREGFDLLVELTPERVSALDLETTLILLSAVARDDHFSNGAWGEFFESGKGLWLFERWLELVR